MSSTTSGRKTAAAAAAIPLLQRFYSLESIASEPWNNDSCLYLPRQAQCLTTGAPALAALIYLKELNLKYTIEQIKNSNEISPSGRGPVLKCGRYVVGEYEIITNFCNLKNLGLIKSSVEERKAYLNLIESQLSDLLDYFLYKLPNTNVKQCFTDVYPRPLDTLLYYREYYHVRNRLGFNDKWLLTEQQLLVQFNEFVSSLNRKLDKSDYLIENRLSEVDLLLFAYLKQIKNFKQFASIQACLSTQQNLQRFYANLNANYFDFIKKNFNTLYDL